MANTKSNLTTMEELLAHSQKPLLGLTRGQEVEGKVLQITDKEIILEIGAKSEGVVLQRELPENKLKVGDDLKAFVIEPENESGQVILSLKRAAKVEPGFKKSYGPDLDWERLALKYNDQIVKGTVTKVTQFGVFVSLEEGLEGLIHVSKLGPDDNFNQGEVISISVDSVDMDKKRIALSPVITSTKGLMYK